MSALAPISTEVPSPAIDDALLTSKAHASLLEPLATRIARVEAFLALLNPRLELEVVPLKDVAGPTGWDPDVQALVVSRESVSGGEMSEHKFNSLAAVLSLDAQSLASEEKRIFRRSSST